MDAHSAAPLAPVSPAAPAAIRQQSQQQLALSGAWTARGIGAIEQAFESVHVPAATRLEADGSGIEAMDTAGAWVLQKQLLRLRQEGAEIGLQGLRP